MKKKRFHYSHWLRGITGGVVAGLIISMTGHSTFAADYSFAWSVNPPPVTGYRLYYKNDGTAGPPFYGTGAAEGPSPVELGNQTSFTLTGLDDNETYHFALTALNGEVESDFSPVISISPGQIPGPNPIVPLTLIQLLLLDDDGENLE